MFKSLILITSIANQHTNHFTLAATSVFNTCTNLRTATGAPKYRPVNMAEVLPLIVAIIRDKQKKKCASEPVAAAGSIHCTKPI